LDGCESIKSNGELAWKGSYMRIKWQLDRQQTEGDLGEGGGLLLRELVEMAGMFLKGDMSGEMAAKTRTPRERKGGCGSTMLRTSPRGSQKKKGGEPALRVRTASKNLKFGNPKKRWKAALKTISREKGEKDRR